MQEPRDLAVPAPLLAHALRTPLNLVEGNALLLASGVAGPLDEVGLQAVADMRLAARTLTRTLAMLDLVVSGVPPMTGGADGAIDLLALVDRVAQSFGWAPTERAPSGIGAVAWTGWETLLLASFAALDERLASTLVLVVDPEAQALHMVAEPFVVGSGDTALGGWLVGRVAHDAAVDLQNSGVGQLRWCGDFAFDRAMTRHWRR